MHPYLHDLRAILVSLIALYKTVFGKPVQCTVRIRVAIPLLLCAATCFASPWIEVGDERLRHDLNLLNDSGVISLPLTTWPLMWADVKVALEQIDRSKLSPAQKMAVRELNFEQQYQTRAGLKRSLSLAASSSRPLFRDFSASYREQAELHHTLDWDSQNIALKLQANVTSDPGDDSYETQLNGSYFAGVMGEWVLGVGAIDRWWGPGWQSNLILTNNARPVPALIFQTRRSQSFESPWLSWLGQWQFVSFVGQLESNRAIPEAKLTGMRFAFKPISQLELGLSRAMQWGGEGRDQDFGAFWDSLTSQGENAYDGTAGSGNQLGGFDARFSFACRTRMPSAIYAQAIGEDEASYMPAKYTLQVGIESAIELPDSANSLRGFIEYTNTTAGAFSDDSFNVAYEHSAYQTGYRYRSRVLGATFDNDAKALTLGTALHLADGQLYKLVLNAIQLNEDGVRRGNTVSAEDTEVISVDLSHQRIIGGGRLKLGVSFLSDVPSTTQLDIRGTAVFGSWEYRF